MFGFKRPDVLEALENHLRIMERGANHTALHLAIKELKAARIRIKELEEPNNGNVSK